MLNNNGRSSSARTYQASRGTDARSKRGTRTKNKDELSSDRDNTMSVKPAANKDEFGSRHNQDMRKAEQYRMGREKGWQNSSFRESAQDERAATGKRNKTGTRRTPKSGHPTDKPQE